MSAPWAIVLAAGGGDRFGCRKQFASLDGRTVLHRALETATAAGCETVAVVPDDVAHHRRQDATVTVAGGSTRTESVRAGLAVVPADAAVIVVHDAARPLASRALWDRVIGAVVAGASSAVPVVELVDSVRWCDGPALDRALLRGVQTPQAFAGELLRRVHRDAGRMVTTDDAGMFDDVVMVPGEASNVKLTHPFDLAVVVAIRKQLANPRRAA